MFWFILSLFNLLAVLLLFHRRGRSSHEHNIQGYGADLLLHLIDAASYYELPLYKVELALRGFQFFLGDQIIKVIRELRDGIRAGMD
jgi:hypothetical protein